MCDGWQVGWMESPKASQRKWSLGLDLQECGWLPRRSMCKGPERGTAAGLEELKGQGGCREVSGGRVAPGLD